MRSIDANIAVRWLTGDDPRQAALAGEVLAEPVFISLTVLVEIAWVLRRSYRFDRAALNEAITILIDLRSVTVASESGVRWALTRQMAGADLPDMLHLIVSRGARSFATFERRMADRAGPDTPLPIDVIA